jgi:hypothetical protein
MLCGRLRHRFAMPKDRGPIGKPLLSSFVIPAEAGTHPHPKMGPRLREGDEKERPGRRTIASHLCRARLFR